MERGGERGREGDGDTGNACQTDSQLNWYKNTKFTQICTASSSTSQFQEFSISSTLLVSTNTLSHGYVGPVKRVSYLHLPTGQQQKDRQTDRRTDGPTD